MNTRFVKVLQLKLVVTLKTQNHLTTGRLSNNCKHMYFNVESNEYIGLY